MPAEWDKPLDQIQVPDLETGRAWVKEIEGAMRTVLQAAADCVDNEAHKGLTDRHYDLGKIRNRVQKLMGKFVGASR